MNCMQNLPQAKGFGHFVGINDPALLVKRNHVEAIALSQNFGEALLALNCVLLCHLFSSEYSRHGSGICKVDSSYD